MPDKYIEIYFITKEHCFKCENVKSLVRSLDAHPNIAVVEVSGEQLSKEYMKQYDLKITPTLMVFVNGEHRGNIERGFTRAGIARQLKLFIKIDTSQLFLEQ